ncbi:MAG: UDP-3-O-(3-hydroxymyristoyl)glucosamine N-acyltransferase [Verrucomicrobiae bacterium]|nr:UDP-3-O-(3-hydroxymyristoyl)glucosamine N-acyltransferase [Verrucomicrobiae bacterium]
MAEIAFEQIVALTGGQPAGEPPAGKFTGVNSLKEAGPSEVSFLGNKKYRNQISTSHAGLILVAEDFAIPPGVPRCFLRVPNPSVAFARVVAQFAPPGIVFEKGIDSRAAVAPDVVLGNGVTVQAGAVIEPGARIGEGTVIGAHVYVGHGTVIGAGCHLYPNVSVRERCVIGDRVILHCGAVIGSDGFGFDLESASPLKIPQIGIVQIDDDVEIGANTTVDRARFGKTWIQAGAKIDNLVQIAHNVIIRKNAIIVAQVGISGSTVIGERAILAGQAGLVGHIEVGDRAIVTAQTGVAKNVPPGQIVSGHHAMPMKEFLEVQALVNRLPEIVARLRELEKKNA